MREGLWGVSKLLTTPRDLLREHQEMVREAEHVLEQVDGPDEVLWLVHARPSQCFHKPKRAHAEGAFATAYTCKRGGDVTC